MPFFEVVKGHDAYVEYSGVVEASDVEEALMRASTWPTRGDVNWVRNGNVSEFDDADYFADRTEPVEAESFEEAVQQIHDAYDFKDVRLNPAERDTVLAALRYYQAHLPSVSDEITEIATCGGEHPALDANAIDDLCEEINLG